MPSYLVVGNQTLDSPELAAAIDERLASEPATAVSRVAPGRGRAPGCRSVRLQLPAGPARPVGEET